MELITHDKKESEVIGRGACPIIIMQRPRTEHREDIEISIFKKLQTWCFINRGEFSGIVTFERNIVCMDEKVWIKIDLDNSLSSIPVKEITCSLRRILKMNTKFGHGRVVKSTILKHKLGECPKGEIFEEMKVKIDLDKLIDDALSPDLEDLEDFEVITGKLMPS